MNAKAIVILLWWFGTSSSHGCIISTLNPSDFKLNGLADNLSEHVLHLNRGLDIGASSAYLKRKINVLQPWRFQFQYSLDCAGYSFYPYTIGDGFTVIIQNEPQGLNFIGNKGQDAGYCPPDQCRNSSFVIMFSFYDSPVNKPFIRLAKYDTPYSVSLATVVSPDPKWDTLDAKTCGIVYDTIVDFNGTHLSLLMDSPQPWFSYPVNMNDLIPYDNAFIGWTSGSEQLKLDVILKNTVLFESCSDTPLIIRTEKCKSINLVTTYNDTLFYSATPSSILPNSIDLDLPPLTSASAFFKEKVDVTAPFTISFQLTPICSDACFGNGFTFIIQDDSSRLGFIGDNGAGLIYNSRNNYAAIAFNNGDCLAQTSSFYLFSSNTTGIDIPPSPIATMQCNITNHISIHYNKTTLSVYHQDVLYITYPVLWNNLLLIEGDRFAYVGWTVASTADLSVRIESITISRYTSLCLSIPIFTPTPIPTPTPPPIPSPSPPYPLIITVKSNITYTDSLNGYGKITLTNATLHVRGSLNFTGQIIFNTLLPKVPIITVEGPIDLSKCTIIIDLSIPPPLNEEILLISTNDTFHAYPIIVLHNTPQCLSHSTTYRDYLSMTFTVGCNGENTTPIIIGAVLGSCCLIFVVVGGVWWRQKRIKTAKALDNLLT